MKKIFSVGSIIVLFIMIGMFGCTANQRAKGWGGTMEINLPTNTKLVNATWKNEDLWYLTRPMRDNESPEESCFVEDSSFGMIEGKVIFKETKNAN